MWEEGYQRKNSTLKYDILGSMNDAFALSSEKNQLKQWTVSVPIPVPVTRFGFPCSQTLTKLEIQMQGNRKFTQHH